MGRDCYAHACIELQLLAINDEYPSERVAQVDGYAVSLAGIADTGYEQRELVAAKTGQKIIILGFRSKSVSDSS